MARTPSTPVPETPGVAKDTIVATDPVAASDLGKTDTSTTNELPQAAVQPDSLAEAEPTSAPKANQEPLDQSGMLTLYPIRSYLDGKDIKRAGGEGYKSPKHDAVLLIAKGLATLTDPKG